MLLEPSWSAPPAGVGDAGGQGTNPALLGSESRQRRETRSSSWDAPFISYFSWCFLSKTPHKPLVRTGAPPAGSETLTLSGAFLRHFREGETEAQRKKSYRGVLENLHHKSHPPALD